MPRSASAPDIHHAFRTLARQCHPDVSAREDAAARFQELSTAYEVLHDPMKRARYDRAAVSSWSSSPLRPTFTSRRGTADVARFLDDELRLGPIVVRLSAVLRWLS